MPNILVRDLSQNAIDRIDAAAANLGISRNEYLRRKLEESIEPTGRQTVTAEDWEDFAEVFADLADPEVMSKGWEHESGL